MQNAPHKTVRKVDPSQKEEKKTEEGSDGCDATVIRRVTFPTAPGSMTASALSMTPWIRSLRTTAKSDESGYRERERGKEGRRGTEEKERDGEESARRGAAGDRTGRR